METCELCNSGYRPQHHHLTYVPEKIIVLCYPCHSVIHILAKIPKEKRISAIQTMSSLIEAYSSHWDNGTVKYLRSPHKMKYQKEYHKKYGKGYNQKNKKCKKEYNKEYYQKNRELYDKYHRQWREANKEKTREYNKRAYKKRMLKD